MSYADVMLALRLPDERKATDAAEEVVLEEEKKEEEEEEEEDVLCAPKIKEEKNILATRAKVQFTSNVKKKSVQNLR
ncbi:hypothetical protein ANN_09720 [Periplaneta americana]|uniref:Uncharacterized protein n=1 Tax=Periplaneta americana TaxID=6978 RepID=A0ABQ8TNU2_PERAM|nr:hypothetical protein ANN_09720 [Periplaneta americana]